MCAHVCSHACVLSRRYIWAHRQPLARSVHDMAKQMYNNKKYSPKAWLPLKSWLFDVEDVEDDAVADRRLTKLTKFNNKDTEFHEVVALCLWNLANGTNLPWGRSAVQAKPYALIPIHEKVIGVLTSFFFLSFDLRDTHICVVSTGSYVCDSFARCS